MVRILEGRFNVDTFTIRRLEATLNSFAVRDDVKTPFLEIANFVLRLADDDLDDGLVQPVGLSPTAP